MAYPCYRVKNGALKTAFTTAVECVNGCAGDVNCKSADFNLDGGFCYFHFPASNNNCDSAKLDELDAPDVYHFKKEACGKSVP